ncbi:uncharacterized protein AAHN32_001864 [Aegotheles albertisi]
MGSNLSSNETFTGTSAPAVRTRPVSPFNLLTVKILRVRNARKADLLTLSDCYVTLWLPTASAEKVRTRTIRNSKNPVWNEAFCYKVDRRVKNVLELKVCDEDTITRDDELCTVLFDIDKLTVGRTVRVKFQLNPQAREELEVEFTLQNTLDYPDAIITNGVLVAREVSCLEVRVDTGKLKQQSTNQELAFIVKGSHEGSQKILLDSDPSLRIIIFHCVINDQTRLDILLPEELADKNETEKSGVLSFPLNSLPLEKEIIVAEDHSFHLCLTARKCSGNLDVRLGFSLCMEEQDFLRKRKKYVAAALKKILHLEEDLKEHEVPVVAITTTGGGTRSLTAMYGSLLGLQKLNLLDCFSYIGGLSGTTWTMANLYEDANWSQKYLEDAISDARKHVTKSKISCFSLDCLKYYYNDLMERTKEGHNTSFIDLWGLVIESMLHDKKDEHRLSDQRQAVDNGQNPLPVYVAINLKSNYSAQAFREWLEFTPYEVGLLKYGASIRAEHFGSEFFMGRLVKRLSETRICYMQGMWSSIFSIDVMYVWNLAADSEDFWCRWTRDRVKDIEEEPFLSMNPYEVDTCLFTPSSILSSALRDVLTGRPTIAQYPNFIRGFQMHNKYLESEGFSTWKDTVIDSFPNKLMETADDELSLVDTGFFINTSYPPLLRSKREVDVILHLNYSGGSQTLPLDQIAKYISGQGIPFPKIEISEEDRENLKECYVFEDADSPQAPTVLFFPLVNDTFKKYKAPGVERIPEEMPEGKVDVSSILSPFTTREVCFSEKNFDRLVKLTDYNILNNEKLIIQALRLAVARRKQRNYYYKDHPAVLGPGCLHLSAAGSDTEKTKMGLFFSKSQTEPSPCNLLTVKIIQMKNARKADLLTQSDCYVNLSLPTASVQHFRTKTVQNNKNPTWNETFHFRIQSQVKNILELKVCDEDNITQDDHLLTVFFDVSKIQLGENIKLCFQLNPQGKEELEVEFTMESSPDPPENIVTNGVLVSREVSCLEVQVNGGRLKKDSTERKFALTVEGSYEGTQTHTLSSCLCPASPARFHYIKYNQSALTVALPRRRRLSRSISSQNERDMNDSVTLPLNLLPIQEKITIAEDRTIDLYTKANEWTQGLFYRPRNLDARLGFDLCADEQNFLQNRRKVVAAALKDVLHLEEDLQEHEVPIVAVTTAGCGIRALTAMYGSILGLQKLRVLDCVSYISGSSGTTWTMTKLYEDADWSRKDLGDIIIEARNQAAKCKMGAFCLRSLRNYYRELSQRTQAGHKTSFIDLWGLMIESMLNDGKCYHRLSDQRRAVNQGQNPLPIYLALNVKDKVATKDFREWVEFTPYEVGFLKYGAFIRAEDFGSEFFMGRLMKKLPESRICFMQGMWSSIFSKNLLDAWHAADNSEDFWHRWTQDKVTEIEEQPDLPEKPYEMATCMFTPTSGISTALRDILTDRPAVSKYHNFLRGFQMHNEYIQQEHFIKWKDTLLDTSPNELRGNSEHLELVDAAFFFETSCPPLMRPERKVDVIIHLNYTGGSQTLPLEQACRYFSQQGIPFPNIGLKDDEKNLKECYMFDGADTPGAPLLLYFPLVNDTFQRYVAPGMSRSAAEMELGKVDISSFSSPYSTREVSLKAEDFNKLLKLTNYNVMNNENMILQALRMAVARKKQALNQPLSQSQSSS